MARSQVRGEERSQGLCYLREAAGERCRLLLGELKSSTSKLKVGNAQSDSSPRQRKGPVTSVVSQQCSCPGACTPCAVLLRSGALPRLQAESPRLPPLWIISPALPLITGALKAIKTSYYRAQGTSGGINGMPLKIQTAKHHLSTAFSGYKRLQLFQELSAPLNEHALATAQ